MSTHPQENRGLINRVYNQFLRPHLPYKIAVLNGVAVRDTVRLFDMADEVSDYKEANIEGLKRSLTKGDDVVVIGGGNGVTATIAARNVESDGSVSIFEASVDQTEVIQQTLALNQIEGQCELSHAIVGNAKNPDGEMGTPSEVDPGTLPDCDVLEIDCEGAELGILQHLQIRPRAIIVETHPKFDAPTAAVSDTLCELGYRISKKTDDPLDGHILTAELVDC